MAEALLVKSGGGTDSSDLTATLSQVLSGYTAMTSDSDDDPGTGTMPNRGAVNQTLNAGGSYTIPQGYHNGNGKVAANSLASQTSGNASSAQILTGYNAWVNGSNINGAMPNRGNLDFNPSSSTSQSVPAGYYSGGALSSANAYNAGYNAGYAAVSLYDISSSFSEPVYVDSPSQAHRVTALTDLTEYKYIILAFSRRNEMWMGGGLYVTNCTQIGYLVAGDMGVAALTNVANGATIDFQHAGTGTGYRVAWGIK